MMGQHNSRAPQKTTTSISISISIEMQKNANPEFSKTNQKRCAIGHLTVPSPSPAHHTTPVTPPRLPPALSVPLESWLDGWLSP